jgi:hypothetical protein
MFRLRREECRELCVGRFGQLSVSDHGGVRTLSCSGICHGSMWLDPPAVIDGMIYRPGPIPEAEYLLGWLLAAAARPDGHVLMAGLGSGAGPIALAWAFPELRITVAEIDPAVVELARRHFPLLPYYEQQGRIRVVTQDIVELAWTSTTNDWSLACLDAFENGSHLHCPPALLQALHGRAEALWLNVLEVDNYRQTRRYADLLIDCGWEPTAVMAIVEPAGGGLMYGNVLLGTQPLALERLRNFAPFTALDHRQSQATHAELRSLIARTKPWESVAPEWEEI